MMYLFLLFFLISCQSTEVWRYTSIPRVAGSRAIVFYVDIKFTDAEVVEIKESIREWDYALNGNFTFRYAGRHDMEDWILAENQAGRAILVNKVFPDCSFIPESKNKVLAFALHSVVYIIEGRVSTINLRGVMLHEIGHILGLSHFGNSLMKPEYDWGMHYCVSEEVVHELGILWGFNSMNYCEGIKL